MADNVKCCDCGWKGLVTCGSNICPECGADFALSWIEDEPQEVEE